MGFALAPARDLKRIRADTWARAALAYVAAAVAFDRATSRATRVMARRVSSYVGAVAADVPRVAREVRPSHGVRTPLEAAGITSAQIGPAQDAGVADAYGV